MTGIKSMKIYIKNMVCKRCKMLVKSEFEKLDIHLRTLELGKVETTNNITQEKLKLLDNNLRQFGLELIENRKIILVEKIKTAIVILIHYSDVQLKINLSNYLSEKLNYNYTYLANVFSEVKGITIEKFYLTHKIEKVKELIIYDELNLTEIADKLQYSSVAHLSNQFRRTTGLAPSQFKRLQHKNRLSLEQVCN
jgi:AraC-like DNA-binding protein